MMYLVLCSKIQEQPEGYPILQNQISSIPIGTWSQHTGRASKRQLRTSRLNVPLITCLDFLLEGTIHITTFQMRIFVLFPQLIHKTMAQWLLSA
jgi:hypothetical protein